MKHVTTLLVFVGATLLLCRTTSSLAAVEVVAEAAVAAAGRVQAEVAAECRPRPAVRRPWAELREPQHDPRLALRRRVAARPARRGAGAAARPAARRGAPAARPASRRGAAGARPSAGQLNNFLDMPRASTGAVGQVAVPGRAPVAPQPISCKAAAGPQRHNFRPEPAPVRPPQPRRQPVSPLALAPARRAHAPRICPPIVPAASRTDKSCRATVNSGATRSATRSPRTTLVSTSGATIPAGQRGASLGPIAGQPGRHWVPGLDTVEPTSYAYGESVYYEGDQVYYGDQAVATADQYAQQAETIAAGAAQTKPESGEWMPLGVFAITQDNQAAGVEPTIFMQLAISKEGVISGTLKNTATDQVQTLEGMADKKSQRVAWSVAGQKRPIMETGISNLTQDSSPALDPLCRWPDAAGAYGAAAGAKAEVSVACPAEGHTGNVQVQCPLRTGAEIIAAFCAAKGGNAAGY